MKYPQFHAANRAFGTDYGTARQWAKQHAFDTGHVVTIMQKDDAMLPAFVLEVIRTDAST